jgi:putative exporter of polyketide antibiotics
MLWWFLILGVSAAMVVLVAVSAYLRVRRQMKSSLADQKPEFDDRRE